MIIRYATEQDTIRIIHAIQNKHMDYNTPADVHEDVKNGCLLVAEENARTRSTCSVKSGSVERIDRETAGYKRKTKKDIIKSLT